MNSKNKVLATLLIFFITLEVLIAFDYIARQSELRSKRSFFYSSVIALQNEIGYVGLIHNFKNAILRPDDTNYIESALVNYEAALQYVGAIEREGSDVLGNLKMTETRIMLDAYRDRIERLPTLLSQNLTISEIDGNLRFDDEPSHTEIETVALSVKGRLEEQMSALLSSRLRFGLITLVILLLTLTGIIRFFFKEQQTGLLLSQKTNAELEKNKTQLMRSQNALLSLMEDVKAQTNQTSELNAQLIVKNREMEQFIYTVSHDLKSPLVTIAGFTQKVLQNLSSDTNEKEIRWLNRIKDNAAHMETLLSELLELSKIVQQEIEKTNVDVGSLVDKPLGVLEQSISDSGASITIEKMLLPIYANERLLGECIQNLLTNAINYRDKDRPLTITIGTVKSKLPNSELPATSLFIEDNGIGISSKYQKLVFGIFERLEQGQGTGVGLTIVKTIMDKHKGDIDLKSEAGKGCRFTLTFADHTLETHETE